VSDAKTAPIDPALRIAAVALAVGDLDASIDFYGRALGLQVLERDGGHARLGIGAERDSPPVLELRAIERPVPLPVRASGLFHIAWLHPSRAALAETVKRLAAARWRFDGASDHGVSEALYLSDPDGLGIEIYADRPRETWRRGPDGIEMVTLPLDVEDLLAQWPDAPAEQIAAGTTIGHVHLKVADVERAARVYEQLGFEPQARLAGAAFLSAGGYHHHIGLNSWQSAGAPPAPRDAPGLRAIDFELSGEDELRRIVAAADADESERSDDAVSLHDADGELLRFRAALSRSRR
jgi:catechol 2,3-dioxygenase